MNSSDDATASDLSKPLKAASPNGQGSGNYYDEADINALLDESNSNSPARMRRLFHKHFNSHIEEVCGRWQDGAAFPLTSG